MTETFDNCAALKSSLNIFFVVQKCRSMDFEELIICKMRGRDLECDAYKVLQKPLLTMGVLVQRV